MEVSPDGNVVQIPLSDEERIAGVPTLEHLQQAIITLHRDGIVILNNAMDTTHLDIINEKMSPDSFTIEKDPNINYNGDPETGNYSQYPKVFPEYLFEDVYANGIIAKVVSCMLGPNPELRWIHGNTALHGKKRQQTHVDLDFDDHLEFCFAITVNFYLVDVGPANGGTEWWVGTHRFGNKNIRKEAIPLSPYILDDVVEARRKVCPPVQPFVPKGSIVIRDLRIWHNGVPNTTDIPRIMFGWIYFAKWYGNKQKNLYFPESCRNLVERYHGEVDMLCAAQFIPDDKFNLFTVPFLPSYGGAGRGLHSGENPLEVKETATG